jgi:superfamily II DNA or RNA helicase
MFLITITKPSNFPFYFLNGTLPDDVFTQLDIALSYYIKDHEFLTGDWDGRVRLLQLSNKGNNFFPIGLIEKVESILICNNIDYKIQEYFNTYKEYDFNWLGFELRDYQVDAINCLQQQRNQSGIVSLPTGAGKTLIGLYWAYLNKTPFVVIVHRKELLYQWKDEIKLNLGIDAGIVGDGVEEWGDICTVAMVQTLHQKVKNKKPLINYPLIIFDECHTIPADTAYKVAMSFLPKFRLGLSATPYREDNADIKIFGAIGLLSKTITPEYLVENGYLAKPIFIFQKLPPKVIYSEDFNTVYVKGIVENEERNKSIADWATKLVKDGRSVYIHTDRIKHGLLLKKMIPNSMFISGQSTNRQEIIKMFATGELSCLISTLLKEGVNIPSMDALIYASGKKSAVATIQTIGRVLRPQVGKNDAIIIDFKDNGNRLLLSHYIQRKQNYIKVFGKLVNTEE